MTTHGIPQPDVSVLIVNYQSTMLLKACLDALLASTAADRLEVIVVDNASMDFDTTAMRRAYPTVQFLPQDRNTTFTAGTNIGYGRASGRNVLLLNPDTRIAPDAIERALGHLGSDRDVVAVGAYLVEESGELQRYYRRLPSVLDVPVILFEVVFRLTSRGRRYLMADQSFAGSTMVEQPPGAFLLVRGEACPSPLLEPVYFNFFSDVRLCEILLAMGEIRVYDDVRCVHLRGGAGARTTDFRSKLRLHQDITWGLRRYFGARLGIAGRAYLEFWILLFWASRVTREFVRRPASIASSMRAAALALRGRPPSYS